MKSWFPLAALGAALALGGCSEASPGDAAFGRKVRAYLLEHPEVLEEAIVKLEQKRAAQTAATQTKALAANRQQLERDPRDFALGPADARVTVVQFFDYRCPYCKTVADDYVRIAREHPDVRFVFKEWPILDRGGEPVSEYAARAALAAKAQGKYLPVHQGLMSQRALDAGTVDRVLAANGVDLAAAKKVVNSREVGQHVADVAKLAAQIGASGTPQFVVAGRPLEFTGPESLSAAIAEAKRRGSPARA
jgi:protein-disulfide isomerase